MLRPVAFRMKHTNVRRIAKLPHIRQVGKGAPLASLVLIAPSLAWFFLQPAAVAAPGPSPVRMWEEEIRLPTYEPGKPDKNPIFYSGRSYQGAKGPVYPYPLLDTLTDVRKDRPYRAVYLENRYVQFCVLPELGGRVFAGVDKTNRYDFIYRQHVIKPALIGMVGAWISGGIEWNIPHHHRAFDVHAGRPPAGGECGRQQDALARRDRAAAPHEVDRGLDPLSRQVVPGGHGKALQPHTAAPLDALFLQCRRTRQSRLPNHLPPEHRIRHAARQAGVRPLADRTRDLRRTGPPRRRFELVEEPPRAGLHLRLELRRRLFRRLRPRQAGRRGPRRRSPYRAGQEVLRVFQ